MRVTPKPPLNDRAQRRRRWVPVALRAPAPAETARRLRNRSLLNLSRMTRWVTRRAIAALLVAIPGGSTLLLAGPPRAIALDYPTRTVTIIVPFPAGGGTDVQARLIAKGLAEQLGKPVVVDNRPGAGGRIGTMLAARAAPDGHTLLLGSITTLVVEPALRRDVGYDVARDFEAITVATTSPGVLVVNPALAVRSVADLVTLARKRPRELTYASPGPGSTAHLFTEAFKHSTQIDILHVPYRGEGPAIIDVMGGQISLIFSSVPAAISQLKAGKLRALGVTGTRRMPFLPDVPTLKESGVSGMELQAWWGFVAPAKTPPEIIARLNRELVTVLTSAQIAAALERQGAVVAATPPEGLAAQVQSQTQFISALVRTINFRLEE
jgi:tripartite-type tricarboxylate transporter receptor subunit TctC